MFDAKEINLEAFEGEASLHNATGAGRGYAVAGGVAGAIESCLKEYYPDISVHIEHAESLAECKKVLTLAKAGKLKGCMIEGMACPGGCVGGGGQPILGDDQERAADRASVLYGIDRRAPLRFSHENPEVLTLYRDYLDAPLSEMAEHFLHTDHEGWEMPAAPIRPDLD